MLTMEWKLRSTGNGGMMQIEVLKGEISKILDRYQIPMDDKSFIMDKIEAQVSELAQAVSERLDLERGKIQAQVQGVAEQAKGVIHGTLEKAKTAVQQAYQLGMREGVGQTAQKPGFSWFQILVLTAALGVAGVFVLREIRSFFGGRP